MLGLEIRALLNHKNCKADPNLTLDPILNTHQEQLDLRLNILIGLIIDLKCYSFQFIKIKIRIQIKTEIRSNNVSHLILA